MQLSVQDLSLTIETPDGASSILQDISFDLAQGARLGIVGESGSGKSMTALSIIGLLPQGSMMSGRIDADGQNLAEFDDPSWSQVRGKRIAMIFQEPMTALNPVKTIGYQVAEAAMLHLGQDNRTAMRTATHWLARVGLPEARFPVHLYPHQLSGGQRQRVLIAAALAGEPDILIADEPTTALDATIQRQILSLIDALVVEHALSLIIISHDLGVIAAMADDIIVMNDGQIVERESAARLFAAPCHPYTTMLLDACPRLEDEVADPRAISDPGLPPLLAVSDIHCRYAKPGAGWLSHSRYVDAVRGVSFSLHRGQCLGIVGESGSGKSTLAKVIAGLVQPHRGSVAFDGNRIDRLGAKQRLAARLPINMIFQDPYGSLNPRHTVLRAITEPLHREALSREDKRQAAIDALAAVQLESSALTRYPHQFSGGQRQRIAIARALIAKPELIIADEPVAALDVSVQARIIELLNELRHALDLTMLFISHDLAVIRHTTDRTLVMCDGLIVEAGATAQIFKQPEHDYTKSLVAAVLPADPNRARAQLHSEVGIS